MKLKELRLTDVLSHVDSKIELGETLTVLTGRSESGKSGALRGLLQLCRNEPAGIDLLRHAAKRGACSEVALTGVTDDGTPFTVTRRRGKSKNEYDVNGTTLLAFGQDVPVEVKSLLRLSPHAFQIQSDGSFMLSATEGAVAKILSSTVGLAEIDAAFTEIRSRKTANDTALRCAEADAEREAEADAAYAGMEASAAAVEDFEAACLRLSEAEDAVAAMTAAISFADGLTADARTQCERAFDLLRDAMAAAVIVTTVETEFEMARAFLGDYDCIPANASKQRIAAISAVNAAETAARLRDNALAELAAMLIYIAEAERLIPDANGAISEAAALIGNAVITATAFEKTGAAVAEMRAALSSAQLREDADADIKAALRSLNYAGAEFAAAAVAEGKLAEMRGWLQTLEAVQTDCEYGERVFADVTAEIARYKATNPVCPECGAEQRHWRTS